MCRNRRSKLILERAQGQEKERENPQSQMEQDLEKALTERSVQDLGLDYMLEVRMKRNLCQDEILDSETARE